MTGKIVVICIAWVLAAILIASSVLDPSHALLLAGCATGVILVWPRYLPSPARLADLPYHQHLGGRRDLSQLSWSVFERDGSVSPKARARVVALADDRPDLAGLAATIAGTNSPTPAQVQAWLDLIASDDKETND